MPEQNPDKSAPEDVQIEDELVRMLSDLQAFLLAEYTKQGRDSSNQYKFDPSNTDRTKRTHARITDEQNEWVDEQLTNKFFSSKEMVIGACVAFAARHESRFGRFVLRQAYIHDLQEMGIDEQELYISEGNSDKERADSDENSTTVNSEQKSTKESSTRTTDEQFDRFDEQRWDGEEERMDRGP